MPVRSRVEFKQANGAAVKIVIHSATKFLCGHSDVTAGALITSNSTLHKKVAFQQNAEGAGLSPFESWLLLRGIKTLCLRGERQSASACSIAQFLSEHAAVEHVNFPGLRDYVDHQLHRRQATGDGAVISFQTGDASFSQRVVSSTQLFTIAVSFGSVNSAISVPYAMSHASIPQSLKQALAPPPDLVRLSIGIEDVDDLVQDLDQALAIAARHGIASYESSKVNDSEQLAAEQRALRSL
jgi:cysteine-S-conjugate beta-lyase